MFIIGQMEFPKKIIKKLGKNYFGMLTLIESKRVLKVSLFRLIQKSNITPNLGIMFDF